MPRLRLHLRVLRQPNGGVDRALKSARKVFAQAGVTIDVASNQDLDLPLLLDISVSGDCQASGGLTTDQKALFDNVQGIGKHEIVIFFVRTTAGPMSGCSQHPRGSPGALITQDCSRWTLAHEIGHLLELTHVPGSSHLMVANTANITRSLPTLDQNEIATLLKSDLLLTP